MDQHDLVILVDENDQEVGTMPKLEAHQKGVLHRAISVFIFNSKHELLLQQRAIEKYHSGGLWSNTCCSHPLVGEDTMDAAQRRLKEEMGLSTTLSPFHTFMYHEHLDNGLIEHEYDHIFIGITDEKPIINTNEASDWKYISLAQLQSDMAQFPQTFTIWFRIILSTMMQKITQSNLFNQT